MKMRNLAWGVAILLGSTALAPAAPILIDWSTAAVVANPGTHGNYWNSLGTGSSNVATTPLVDSSNAATGISVAVTTLTDINNGGSAFGGTGIAGPTGPAPFDEPNAIKDGIFANDNNVGTTLITFTGLSNSTAYSLSAIGGRASNGVDGTINIVTGTSTTSSYTLKNDGTVLNFSVTPSSGKIDLRFQKGVTGSGPTNSTFNAMSITAAPEPAALPVLGLLAVGALRRRRTVG